MSLKKALCWSFALHLFIATILFILFPLRQEDNTNFTMVNLIDIPSYAALANGTPHNSADIKPTTKKTDIQPFSISDAPKVESKEISFQHPNKTSSTHSKPQSPQIQTSSQNKQLKQIEKTLPDSEPRLKFMAPVNYHAQNGGTSTFKILVSEEGVPLRIEIERGSGNSDLDTAVKEALKQSEYIPAIIDGVSSQGWFTFSYQHWNISNATPAQP